VRNASGSDAFELEVRTGPVASVDECSVQRVEACVRYMLPDQASNMAVLEVNMVTGYVPDRTSLHQLLHQPDSSKCRNCAEFDEIAVQNCPCCCMREGPDFSFIKFVS
jgi:hypothetical protein